jgi:predicted MFS family arabinose efflux permease
MFMGLTALTMFCEGGHFVLLPSHCVEIYKSSHVGVQVYSYLFACFGLSSISGTILSSAIVNSSHSVLGFRVVFKIASGLNVISLITLVSYSLLLKREARKSKQIDVEDSDCYLMDDSSFT